MDIFEKLPGAILPWYDAGHRDLPWRQDKEPYHVWLSEIMLQQTRVEAVKGYYSRFLDALPTVADLAECDDEVLHKLWEGLGYYSRVRNLKKAAQAIMERQGGVFPSSFDAVLALPGIGAYTAGAICSICFDLPTPAVDGNVLRLIARLTREERAVEDPAYQKQVRQLLARVYPERAGDFTQGLMELGATVCGPNREPDCENCPCKAFCQGHLHGDAAAFPVRKAKREKRREEMTLFILSCDGCVALEKRQDAGLLAGLWQFPNVPGTLEPEEALERLVQMGLRPRQLRRQSDKSHIFTHIRWEMRGFYVEVAEKAPGLVWRTPAEIAREAALPTAFRQFWEGS